MEYIYFISYSYFTRTGAAAIGNLDISSDVPVDNINVIREMESLILADEPDAKIITINNFILLRTKE
jgi:hypothetical protein